MTVDDVVRLIERETKEQKRYAIEKSVREPRDYHEAGFMAQQMVELGAILAKIDELERLLELIEARLEDEDEEAE